MGTCISDMQRTRPASYVATIAASCLKDKEMSRSENFQTTKPQKVQQKRRAVAKRVEWHVMYPACGRAGGLKDFRTAYRGHAKIVVVKHLRRQHRSVHAAFVCPAGFTAPNHAAVLVHHHAATLDIADGSDFLALHCTRC